MVGSGDNASRQDSPSEVATALGSREQIAAFEELRLPVVCLVVVMILGSAGNTLGLWFLLAGLIAGRYGPPELPFGEVYPFLVLALLTSAKAVLPAMVAAQLLRYSKVLRVAVRSAFGPDMTEVVRAQRRVFTTMAYAGALCMLLFLLGRASMVIHDRWGRL